MPLASDRPARLFYDDACGPCRFFARAADGVSRHRVVALPFDSPASDGELGDLDPETRFGSAHLAAGGRVRTGAELLPPLVGLAFGATWERVMERVPLLDRGMKRLYLQAWKSRRAHGCGANRPR